MNPEVNSQNHTEPSVQACNPCTGGGGWSIKRSSATEQVRRQLGLHEALSQRNLLKKISLSPQIKQELEQAVGSHDSHMMGKRDKFVFHLKVCDAFLSAHW